MFGVLKGVEDDILESVVADMIDEVLLYWWCWPPGICVLLLSYLPFHSLYFVDEDLMSSNFHIIVLN